MRTIVINRFDKIFGPAGVSAGYALMIGGIVITYYSPYGIFFIILGAFLAFTHTSAAIDLEDKRVRFTNNLFGILKYGKWIEIRPEMSIVIKKNNTVYRSFSRSNRTLDIKTNNFRLFLCDENKNLLLPLKNSKALSDAKNAAEELAIQLNISNL